MRECKYFSTVAVLAIMLGSGVAEAADVPAPALDDSGWTFTVVPYLWGSGIEGKSGLFGFQPQDIDVSFGDILKNLDMAFMGVGEARNGRLSVGIDVSYAKLSTNVDTPAGILASDIDLSTSTFMGTAIAGYSVLYDDSANVDLVAGARVWSVDTSFDFNGGALGGTSASDGDTWVDPVVGAKFRANLGSDFYLAGWGLVGGFGVSSDLMWDVMAGIGYDFNDTFSVFGGYRALGVDYRKGGFVYDITQKGPMFGGVFRF